MADSPLQIASTRLAAYLEAERAVLNNQAYEIAGRRLTRANLAEIQAGIKDCQNDIVRIGTGSGRRIGYLRPNW
jgi:hypothetical protein